MNRIIKVEKVAQPIGTFYIAIVNAYDLFHMAEADIMTLEYDSEQIVSRGIQRRLSKSKVKKIKSYINYKNASFPNSIILNLNADNFIKINKSETELEIIENKSTFNIIDGQHRLKGFEDYKSGKRFDLIVSIFINLSESDQRELFRTINSEQLKVNPSMSLYSHIDSPEYTPRRLVVELAELFTSDSKSPWYQLIKLMGINDEISKKGIISLKPFAEPIINMIYNDDDFYEFKNKVLNPKYDLNNFNSTYKKYIFWNMFKDLNGDAIYKILLNYFDSFKAIYKKEWGNSDSLLSKTTGYNAMMYLFIDLYHEGVKNNKLSKLFFTDKIQKTSSMIGTINSSNYGGSGVQASKRLYKEWYRLIFN